MPKCHSRKIKARKHTATLTEKTGVRCGKWVLRSTKGRLYRGQHFPPSAPLRIAPKHKRKHASSTISSRNSCTKSKLNPQLVLAEKEEDYDDLRNWPEAHTCAFINAMLEEQRRSMGPNCTRKVTGFKEAQWTRIEKEMVKLTGTTKYNKNRLKGKQKRLKFLFNKFQNLRNQSGFGWDPVLGTVTAPPEVWDNYIERVPEAAQFRDKGLPNYELLLELYSSSVATGSLNRASSRGAPHSDDESEMFMSISQSQGGASSGSRKRNSQECDSYAAEKAKKAEMFDKLSKYLELRLAQQGGGAKVPQSCEDPYSIPAAISLLNQYIDYIPEATYFKASNMFSMCGNMRQTWLCTHATHRIGWLMNLP